MTVAAATPLLEVEDLNVTFDTRVGQVRAVREVSFQLGREKLGIVGESGSGKSQTGRALLGLTPWPGRVDAGRMTLDGQDLLGMTSRQMRAVRGSRITMVMQEPKYSLNPVMTVGKQIAEASRRLIEGDAQARRDLLAAQKQLTSELHSERVNLDRQREEMEQERRNIAAQRHRDPMIAQAINAVTNTSIGDLIYLTRAIVNVVMSIFGGPTHGDLPIALNWFTLIATCALSIWMLHRKLRAHEVVG